MNLKKLISKMTNMKKFFTIITLLAMFLVVGCVDLDEVWSQLEALRKQNAEQAEELERKC